MPEGAGALRVDLFGVSSNLDLYAHAGSQILVDDESVAAAENEWGHETLVIERDSEPPLVAGDWYIDVVDAVGPTRTQPFSILTGFDPGVPSTAAAHTPAAEEGGASRALLAWGRSSRPTTAAAAARSSRATAGS